MFHPFHHVEVSIASPDIPREEASVQDSWLKINKNVTS